MDEKQKERKARYDMAYARKNIRRRELPFNLTQPDDQELFQYLEKKPNFTEYIKSLIRQDMEKNPD